MYCSAGTAWFWQIASGDPDPGVGDGEENAL